MLVLSGIDDKPDELYQTSLIRAKYCELVADMMGLRPKELYFTVGLFSTFDALMDQSLENLLAKLNLDDQITIALLQGTNTPGVVLKSVKGIEQGRTDFILPASCSATDLSACYLQAMQFTQRVVG
jgi:EAL and modified HD-GYP domain-containing signal transduction protein